MEILGQENDEDTDYPSFVLFKFFNKMEDLLSTCSYLFHIEYVLI